MLTWTEIVTKTQRLTKDSNADTLTQIKQDLNTGYKLFNSKLSRYFTRKQQFTNLIANQSIYQTPVDAIRILGMTVQVTTNYAPTVKEIVSEYEWRNIISYPTASNYPTFYFVLGNDEIQLWPTPSQNVTNGLRYYYQPQDHDLTIDDVTSTSTSFTVTTVNNSNIITCSGSGFNSGMGSLWFQVTGQTDNTWYEIISATNTILTLKSAYVGPSGSGLAWRVGQSWIIPQEYADAPMHYALGNYFSANGNEERSQYHLGSKEKPGVFYNMIQDCKEEYSSSNESKVITDDYPMALNPWFWPPPASS